jgi:hypothetical protein
MLHVDPEVLALLALGESAASQADRDHLRDCAECAIEVENLARAAMVGRATLDVGALLTPGDRVWARISEELAVEPVVARSNGQPVAREVVTLSSRRRWVPTFAVAASVVLLAGAGLVSWNVLQPAPVLTLASATLDAFPDWPDAAGQATLEERADGARVIELELTANGGTGFRQVWLMNDDATELVSLGVVRGASGEFVVPDGLDISVFNQVDVSSEPLDGNPQHSGDSIVRGQLEA